MRSLKPLKGLLVIIFLIGVFCLCRFTPLYAGQKVYFQGTDYELHVYDIRGREKGTTILIIGGIQGNEPGGYLSADSYADIALKKGRLIIVPRANLPSIILNRRGINADMNRKFKSRSQRIYEERVVAILKKLIRQSDVLLNLHDGSGFYRPVWEGIWKNPMRFGQSIIADAEKFYSKKYCKMLYLGEIARKVAVAVNKKIKNPEYHFHFNNHDTLSPNTRHPEQRKSATYYALTHCGIPAYGIETSKFLPSTHLKVLYHNMVVNEFLKQYGVVMENPKVYMTPPHLEYLVVSINGSQPVVVFDRQTITLSKGDRVSVRGYKTNYTRGITVDMVGYGSKNDFGKTFRLKGNTTLLIRKDRRVFAKVFLKTTKSPGKAFPAFPMAEQHPGRDEPYLVLKVNGELRICKTDKVLKVVKGDKLELIDVISPAGRLPLKLNFVGFVGNRRHNTGEDRGYIIDTASDLMKRFSCQKEGRIFSIKAGDGKRDFYTFKIAIIQPKLREMILFANGGWQHYGNGDAFVLKHGEENVKIGVIQTTPLSLNRLAIKVQGKLYPVPDQLSCRNALSIPLGRVGAWKQSLTIKVLRGKISLGCIYLTWPMRSDLLDSSKE